jgi:hypothetical protein
MRLRRIKPLSAGISADLSAVFMAGSSAFGGFKPQILLKITSQKHTWSPVEKSKESTVPLH